ncbi:HD-GYP domain-containing protein [Pokkaliibacter plantistimulans]|nr:HD-GYP domain-containing protein [Pokkaliibacter plantistimulans]
MNRSVLDNLHLPEVSELSRAELISALSHALDMTEGQPPGHCMRVCWIGMHIGEKLGLSDEQMWELYYTLLLKDLGCSSNAARICELYLTDDLAFKREYKWVNGGLPQVVNFVLKHTGLEAGLAERFRRVLDIFQNGEDYSKELIRTRCERGAAIARQLRFSEGVAEGIHSLDEHWNGKGKPEGLSGDAIPLYARIALLCQVVDVFFLVSGPKAALREARMRTGLWFDPAVVVALEQVAVRPGFWEVLTHPQLQDFVVSLEPAQHWLPLDDDYMDEIAAAFGQVVDSKSPYTAGHSERVGLYTDLVAEEMGYSMPVRRWLKRGALLHDVGKLGVSNTVLDKPGKLDPQEWEAVKMHATYSEQILSRIKAFSALARVAAAHHERLDGTGYPRGLQAEEITPFTRIITTADIFDAISSARPYHEATPTPKTLAIMAQMRGTALDPNCYAALEAALARIPGPIGTAAAD